MAMVRKSTDLSIPPDVGLTPLTAEPLPPLSNEERVCEPIPAEQAEKIPYTKPEIIEPPLPDSSTPEETAADNTEDDADIILSFQYFRQLIREKMHCQDRIEEINAELLMYRDACKSILIDLKEGGIEA